MGGRVEIGFELRTTYSDTMIINHSQKPKLLGNCEFNHLTIILIMRTEIQVKV